MKKFLTVLLGTVFVVSGCALNPSKREEQETKISSGSVTCIKPPPEVLTTALEAKLDASAIKLGEIAKANLTAGQKIEKIRETLPEVQSFEVLEYRFCRMYSNGLIDKEKYNQLIDQVIPQLGKKQTLNRPGFRRGHLV